MNAATRQAKLAPSRDNWVFEPAPVKTIGVEVAPGVLRIELVTVSHNLSKERKTYVVFWGYAIVPVEYAVAKLLGTGTTVCEATDTEMTGAELMAAAMETLLLRRATGYVVTIARADEVLEVGGPGKEAEDEFEGRTGDGVGTGMDEVTVYVLVDTVDVRVVVVVDRIVVEGCSSDIGAAE